eukprot:UN00631
MSNKEQEVEPESSTKDSGTGPTNSINNPKSDQSKIHQHRGTINAEPYYPLQETWTLWYNGPKQSKGNDSHKWEKRFKKIHTFNSVESFGKP